MKTMRDDHDFNINFVKLIEKERCLYDKNVTEYRSKEMHEQIWRKIADDVNDSGKKMKSKLLHILGILRRNSFVSK